MADETNTSIISRTEAKLQSLRAGVEGTLVLLIAIGYIFLVFTLVGLWSDKAGEAVIGFALFAQSLVYRYFDFKRQQSEADKAEK